MTVHYLTEDQHAERMAQAIYERHSRRITLIVPWEALPQSEQEGFLCLARSAIAGADAIREQALAKVILGADMKEP